MDRSARTYRLSFTFGGLLIPETRIIAEEFRRTQDWQAVRVAVVDNGGLGKTRRRTAFRYFREVRERLTVAREWERAIITGQSDASPAACAAVLFVVFCRYYRIVGEFVEQVVRERVEAGARELDASLVRTFFADRETVHPELGAVTQSTRDKLVEITMKVLREAGISRREGGRLLAARPTAAGEIAPHYCEQRDIHALAYLLTSTQEITQCTTQR